MNSPGNILVTGAVGYSSHACKALKIEALIQKVDNLSTGWFDRCLSI